MLAEVVTPTDAVVNAVRATPLISDDIYERVNALGSEPTVDGMAAAAGA
ncbi:MAG: hypothetical protein JWO22_1251 [Frankiales bacterium]|nr:hypothetical protein [Frankiales bacterium]